MMRDSFISVMELSKFMSTHSTKGEDHSVEYDDPIDNLHMRVLIPSTLKSTDFSSVEFLGNGSNCSVFTANLRGKKVAVKMIKERPKYPLAADSEILREADILSRIDHPNIITIHGTGEKIRKFIVLEHLEGGTLAKMLNFEDRSAYTSSIGRRRNISSRAQNNQMSVMPLMKIINIAEAIASALKYLHEDLHPDVLIIHRDLKPQNIGFSKDGQLKIFDFGLMACVRKRAQSTDTYKMSGNTGTLIYMAPEVALNKPYTEKVDIYSFGIILWQLASGVVPFSGMAREEYMQRVVRMGSRPQLLRELPAPLQKLIERCWDRNPFLRPTCSEILELLDSARQMVVQRESPSYGSRMFKVFRGNSRKVADEETLLKSNSEKRKQQVSIFKNRK